MLLNRGLRQMHPPSTAAPETERPKTTAAQVISLQPCSAMPWAEDAQRTPPVRLQYVWVQVSFSRGTAAWMNRGSGGQDSEAIHSGCWNLLPAVVQTPPRAAFLKCVSAHLMGLLFLIKASTTLTLTLTWSKHAYFLYFLFLWVLTGIAQKAVQKSDCQPFS